MITAISHIKCTVVYVNRLYVYCSIVCFFTALPNGIAARRRSRFSSDSRGSSMDSQQEPESAVPAGGSRKGSSRLEEAADVESPRGGQVSFDESAVRFSRTDKDADNIGARGSSRAERRRSSGAQGDGVRTAEGVPQGTTPGPLRTSGVDKDATPVAVGDDRARRKVGVAAQDTGWYIV